MRLKVSFVVLAVSIVASWYVCVAFERNVFVEADDTNPFPVKVERDTYPRPEFNYPNAKIGRSYTDSKPDFPKPVTAPKDAPNVLLVLLDDVGFGCSSTFGGLVEMPTADRLARAGLKYNNFHTTALCSPTRAALLTGRNHHSCATGIIQELATGYPGYSGLMPKSCGTVARMLQLNGYATGFWGKNHNVPDNQTSAAGPFDNWPTNQGFDYFYGFIGGETDHFYPALYRGTTAIAPPKTPEEGYHLTTDLTDDCIAWMRQQKSIAPNRPLFTYFSTGAAHAPHQPPLSWRGKNKGKFDAGWDKYREVVHQRQLKAGIIPMGTKLTPRPKEIPGWDEHTPAAKRLFTREMENFADFLQHTDYEVGRILDAMKEMDELDNTLVIYVIGDNGCSAEGTLNGIINELMALNGVQPKIETMLERIDEIGKPGTSPHFAVPWAWAGATPFQWTKQVASHFGGTRNPVIISWPNRIKAIGGLRQQFHHAIDIVPTILEAVGIKEPVSMDGFPQKPIEGVSMAYTFDKANASMKSRRTRQYFEMFGNRGVYVDGWYACARHGRLPWNNAGSLPFDKDQWELYHVETDFSQANNLAKSHPKKLRELQDAFVSEAKKYNVFPLDDRFAERLDVTLRPSFFYGRKSLTFYPGMTRLPEGSAPKTTSVTHTVTVKATIPKNGAEGVLICMGGDTSGWSLCVEHGKLTYHYNWFDTERYKVESAARLPAGKVVIRMDFVNEGETPGGPASVNLFVNGTKVGSGKLPKQVAYRFGVESLDVGMDTLSPVSRTYAKKLPFAFNGEIESVKIDLK
jgi:arylsulfatase